MNKVIVIIFLMLTATLTAQVKSSSIGLRGGNVSGFTFKHIDDDLKAFEIIAGWQEGGFRVVGLLEKYKQIADHRLANLYLFIGGGLHAGYIEYQKEYVYHGADGYDYYYPHSKAKPVFGGNFILGIDYRFENAPIRIGVDYKPYVQVFGEEGFRVDLWDLGFTVRFEL